MAYTAKKLAQLSGVSTRTLRWYDKIGLLKPASYGDENGYRYYEKAELLMLQQILFFRELGFKLEDIADIVNAKDFDQIVALESHQKHLEEKIERMQSLIQTVKRTIGALQSGKPIEDNRLYVGFYDWAEKQPASAYSIVNTNEPTYLQSEAEAVVLKNLRKVDTQSWSKEDWGRHANEGNKILAALKQNLEKGASPEAEEVQSLIKKHHNYTKKFHYLKPGVYEALAEVYQTRPQFRAQLDHHHPKLAEFMAQAMVHYVRSQKEQA